jgi:hypothetical protein
MKTLLVSIVILSALAKNASATPLDAEAKQHFTRGQKLAAEGRCAEALPEFEAGYALSRRPLFLFNIAECARKTGELARARENYERYLREDPDGATADTARERLQSLPAVEKSAPAPSPTPAPPAPATASPPAANPPIANEPTGPTASSSARAIELTSPPPPAKKPVWKRWPLWVGLGAAVAVSAVAISVGVVYGRKSGNACSGDCAPIDFR